MNVSLCITTPEVDRDIPVALLEGSFEEKLAAAAESGYDGVELMCADPARTDVSTLKAAIAGAGLSVSAVGSGAVPACAGLTLLAPSENDRRAAADRFEELIRFAAELGAPTVTVGSFRGRLSSLGDAGTGRALLAEMLAAAAEYARTCGLRIAVEPLNRYENDFLHTAEEALAFLAALKAPNLGLLLDTFHCNIEEASFRDSFAAALSADRLFHVHIADSNRRSPGKGHIDFPRIAKTLREGSYAGWLSAEHLRIPSAVDSVRDTIAAMRNIEKSL